MPLLCIQNVLQGKIRVIALILDSSKNMTPNAPNPEVHTGRNVVNNLQARTSVNRAIQMEGGL